jgi:type IV pilus biogenesis protein CpaD/CtpE
VKTLLVILLLALAGCSTPPNPAADIPVYRPTAPIHYPVPR